MKRVYGLTEEGLNSLIAALGEIPAKYSAPILASVIKFKNDLDQKYDQEAKKQEEQPKAE